MHWRILLDENLSPQVALTLAADGYDATCVHHRGLLSTDDSEIFKWTVANQYVLVTNNAADFEALSAEYRERERSFPGVLVVLDTSREYTLRVLRTYLAQHSPDEVLSRLITVPDDV